MSGGMLTNFHWSFLGRKKGVSHFGSIPYFLLESHHSQLEESHFQYMKEFVAHYSVELSRQLLLGHCSVMLLSQLPDQLLGSLMPLLCSLFCVFCNGRLKPQQTDDCLQEPKDLITIFDWGPSGGQVASFFPNSSMCMQHHKSILGVSENGSSFSFSCL